MTRRKAAGPPSGGNPQSDAEAQPAAPSTFVDGLPLPKLIVFDLDYTLWPFWVDTHVRPPLTPKNGGTHAIDRTGESFAFYPEVPSILHAARTASIPIALASRTHTPQLARQLLGMLKVPSPPQSSTPSTASCSSPASLSSSSPSFSSSLPSNDAAAPRRAVDFFAHQEIFPGDKRAHMKNLQKAAGVAYEDMLFFDDESRNSNVEALGVCFWLVRDGVTRAEVDAGVQEWRRRRGKGKQSDSVG